MNQTHLLDSISAETKIFDHFCTETTFVTEIAGGVNDCAV